MLALGFPVVLGVLIGVLVGGRLRSWNTTTFDYSLAACCALAVQVAIFDPPLERIDIVMRFGPGLYVASMLVVAAILFHNARSSTGVARSLALGVATLGVVLNCLVVTANGGYMPRAAVDGWPTVAQPSDAGRLVNVAPIVEDTRLVMLGDILPEPDWMPLRNILSVGDVLLAMALGSWAFLVTIGGRSDLRRAV
jgi:hypothetical protein